MTEDNKLPETVEECHEMIVALQSRVEELNEVFRNSFTRTNNMEKALDAVARMMLEVQSGGTDINPVFFMGVLSGILYEERYSFFMSKNLERMFEMYKIDKYRRKTTFDYTPSRQSELLLEEDE